MVLRMARRQTPSPSERPHLSVEQKRRRIARLEECIRSLGEFNPQTVQKRYGIPEVMALEAAIKQALAEAFGEGTQTFYRFKRAASLDNGPHQARMGDAFGRGPRIDYDARDAQEARKYLADGKDQSIALLKEAIRVLEHEIADQEAEDGPAALDTVRPVDSVSRRVFVVHGRDDDAKNEVALFLRRIGLEEIILHLRPNRGRHLLTKFQEEAQGAQFAVILMTPDDEGGMAGSDQLQKRARQNVVFELGFFIGKLGTPGVAALIVPGIEKPSDFDGICWIEFGRDTNWKNELARELKEAGVPFNADEVLRA
jgi:predicted nucleotide-binding protein